MSGTYWYYVSLQSQINSKNSQISSLNSQVATLQTEVNQKTAEINAVNIEKAPFQNQVNALNAELARLKAQDGQNQQTISQLESRINVLNQQIITANTTINNLFSRIDALKQQIATAQGRIPILVQEIESLKAQLVQANTTIDAQAAQIGSLSSYVSSLEQEKAALQKQVSDRNSAISNLQQRIASQKSEITQKNAEIVSLTTQLQNVTEENASLREKIKALEAEIVGLNETNAKYEAQINSMYSEVDGLKNRITGLEDELRRAHDVIIAQSERIEALIKTIDQRNVTIADLQAQILNLQARVAVLSEQLTATNVERASLETSLNAALGTITEFGRVLKIYEEEVATLRGEVAFSQKQVGNDRAVIDTLQKQQKQLWNMYDAKVAELASARKTIENLEVVKASQTAKFKQVEADLVAQLQDIRKKYEDVGVMVKELSATLQQTREEYEGVRTACPTIPNGKYVVDGDSGAVYLAEHGWDYAANDWKTILRPVPPAVYEHRGSPVYTTYPGHQLAGCTKGTALQIEVSKPAPTEAPTTKPPKYFPGTLYVLIHAESWDAGGELRVVSARFGSPTLEPFAFRDIQQVWLINHEGYIRSASGNGEYLTSKESCLATDLSREMPADGWNLTKQSGSELEYSIVSPCGTSLFAAEGARSVSMETVGKIAGKGSLWYVVPIGKATIGGGS